MRTSYEALVHDCIAEEERLNRIERAIYQRNVDVIENHKQIDAHLTLRQNESMGTNKELHNLNSLPLASKHKEQMNRVVNLLHQIEQKLRTESETFRMKHVLQFQSLCTSINAVHAPRVEPPKVEEEEVKDAQDAQRIQQRRERMKKYVFIWTDELARATKAKEAKKRITLKPRDARKENLAVVAVIANADDFTYDRSQCVFPEMHKVKWAKWTQKQSVIKMYGNEHDKWSLERESRRRTQEKERQQKKAESRKKDTEKQNKSRFPKPSSNRQGTTGRGGQRRNDHRGRNENDRRGSERTGNGKSRGRGRRGKRKSRGRK